MMAAPAYRAHPIRNFFRNEGNRWRRHPASALLRLLCRLSVLITIFALLAIVIDLLVKGIPHLTPELFSLKYTTENQSMLPAIINTLLIALVALLVAIPIGVGGAIYLAEYAKRNSPLVRTIRLTAETLQGIPSIIYGLFGMVFFTVLRINLTLLSGALTLSLMVLPLILRTTEEALLSIPDSYREGSFGLGAGKLRTVIKIVLPPAMPGILSGMTMVFVPAVSTFYISQKLGGTDTVLIGDVIERQFKQGNNPNLGAALSLVLMILVFICTGIMNRFGGGNEEGGVIV